VPVIDAQNVSKQFLLRHNASVELKVRFLGLLHRNHRQSVEEFWALKNISLQIERGEGVGLVGRNGSGKSTLLKLIAAIHRPTSGRLLVARHARICSMIELGVGFHPELTGRENVFLNAAIQGLTAQETEAIYRRIVSYSGLEHFIDVPIKNYSSGMYMRLGFAIAANLDPDILLLDEIFAVGDADFQQRCIETLKTFMERQKTIIFVSHAAPAVRLICRRTCVLDQGQLAFDGDVDSGLAFYDRLLGHGIEPAAAAPAPPPHAGIEAGTIVEAEGTPGEAADTARDGWVLELLRQEGLKPVHRVLHVSSQTNGEAGGLRSFLQANHYSRVADSTALFELAADLEGFDFAVAESVFPSLPFNRVARLIAATVRRLKPSGRFYATWFENSDPADFEPITHANGVTTYPDREPYHYPFSLVATVCQALGATVERISGPRHPRDESILIISLGMQD
jgi:ABC-type polysaccharide/polyol phosphate transport system ATPase subunit